MTLHDEVRGRLSTTRGTHTHLVVASCSAKLITFHSVTHKLSAAVHGIKGASVEER